MKIDGEDIIKGAVTFITGLIAANAGKILDWWRGAGKDRIDLAKTGVEMLLDIIERERTYSKQVTESNDTLVKKNHDLQEKNDKLVASNYEKGQMILRLTNEKERCEEKLKRTLPDDRERGRRSEGLP